MQIPASEIPFIWTLRRHRLWHSGCRREYFYHYYAGRGGHEIGTAERFTEACHYCRNLLSENEYRRRVLYLAVSRCFSGMPPEEEASPEPPPSLRAAAGAILEREWEDMLLELPLADHRKPMLLALCRSSTDCREVKSSIRRSLLREVENFERESWPRLAAIPPERRRTFPAPLFLHIGELECCIRPLLGWTEKGVFSIIEAAAPGDSAGEELLAALHRHYVMNTYGYPPGRIRPLVIDHDTGRLKEIGGSISNALRTLRQDTGEMLNILAPDGIACEKKFPVCHDREQCAACRFRSLCSGGDPAKLF